MAKKTHIEPGDGVTTGQSGLVVRGILNDSFPAKEFYVPEAFVWTGDLTAYANIIMVITYDHTVTGTITLGEGTILKFKGGRLLGTVTIVGNKSKISNPDNLQAFTLTTTFDGTWIGVDATVQWFGGVANIDMSVSDNDIMPYIGKLVESGFSNHWVKGNYYVGSELTITRPFYTELGGNQRPDVISILNDSGAWTLLPTATSSEVVRLYSDLDINWFVLNSSYIKILGGIFDISRTTTWTKACYYHNGNDTIDHCMFSQAAVGIEANVLKEGQTGKYFFSEFTGATIAGHIYKVDIDADILYFPYGVIFEPVSNAVNPKCWGNGNSVRGRMTGCKQSLNHETASFANIAITVQSMVCLTESEKDIPQVSIGGFSPIIDQLFVWDLRQTEAPEAIPGGAYPTIYWRPKYPAYLTRFGAILQGSAKTAYRENMIRGVKPWSLNFIDNDTELKLFKDGWSGPSFISDIHSTLLNYDKRGSNTVTVTAYQGTGYDFDDVINSLPATAIANPNITISNPENIVSNIGLTTRYLFGTGTTNYDLDFIEIVFTGESISLTNLYLHLMGTDSAVKRIQVIPLDADNNIVETVGVLNQYPVDLHHSSRMYYDFPLGKKDITTLIIRLIGTTNPPSKVFILDIAGNRGGYYSNFIDKHDYPKGNFEGWINQSGTNIPVVTSFINTFRNSAYAIRVPYTTRQGVGSYRFYMDNSMTTDKTIPREKMTYFLGSNGDAGKVEVELFISGDKALYYIIETFDALGVQSDDILVNFPMFINTYW